MKKKQWLFMILPLVLLTACEKQVNIDIPQKPPRLVIKGMLSKNELFDISIGRSRGILDSDNSPGSPEERYAVKDAIPVIYENGVAIDTLKYEPAGYRYKSIRNKRVRDGFMYSVRVTAPGYTAAEASSAVPSQSVIAELGRLRNARTSSSGLVQDEITIKLNDPAGERNFYLVQVFRSGPASFPAGSYPYVYCVNTNDKDVDEAGSVDDPLSTGKCYDGSALLMRDDHFNGGTKLLKLFVDSAELYEYTDMATMITYRPYIVVYRITEDEFKYRRSYKVYSATEGNPFAEPVNLFSNVKNGYGIFGLSTLAADTLR